MFKVFVPFLFIRSGTPIAAGPAIEIGNYPSLGDCQAAADSAVMKSDEEPREWQPFIGQWVCVERPAKIAAR
jgi:hypothetical protein